METDFSSFFAMLSDALGELAQRLAAAALMKRREKIRRRELMEAVKKSDHTYEEILCFIRG